MGTTPIELDVKFFIVFLLLISYKYSIYLNSAANIIIKCGQMIGITLFNCPGNVYRGKQEREVAELYTNMASHGYDALIKFEPNYASEFVQTPDHTERIGKKQNKDLDYTIFSKQPVISVGGNRVSLISSSNLFTPECHLVTSEGNPLYLPDLEVIEIAGSMNDIDKMVSGIKDLYAGQNVWTVNVYANQLPKKNVKGAGNRFSGEIEVLEPMTLKEIAKNLFGYEMDRLCF